MFSAWLFREMNGALNHPYQGFGMDAQTLARAEEPFFSALEPRRVGLGLEIVRVSVEAHGGKLLLQSELGEGTRARLLFPGACVGNGDA